jgi:hypothetical protein
MENIKGQIKAKTTILIRSSCLRKLYSLQNKRNHKTVL